MSKPSSSTSPNDEERLMMLTSCPRTCSPREPYPRGSLDSMAPSQKAPRTNAHTEPHAVSEKSSWPRGLPAGGASLPRSRAKRLALSPMSEVTSQLAYMGGSAQKHEARMRRALLPSSVIVLLPRISLMRVRLNQSSMAQFVSRPCREANIVCRRAASSKESCLEPALAHFTSDASSCLAT
jgi:hypothetical protein